MVEDLRKYWIIRLLLYPFSVLYGVITDLRNILYDFQFVRVEKFGIPIISIGNLTSGGSRKTPFTMLCIDLLKDHYQNIVIVSRGYGRNSKGLYIVSDGQGNIQSPTVGGDEPVMMALKYPQVPVIVAEIKSEGIKKAIQFFQADLILLDDAFQHRRVARSCDIVLINSLRKLSGERLLPLGDLREKIINLKRADIIILNRSRKDFYDQNINVLSRIYQGHVFECTFRPKILVNFRLQKVDNIKVLNGKKVCIFSAIAEPEQFKNMIIDIGARPVKVYSFPDHYDYTPSDLGEIKTECRDLNCQYLVTTEKDMVKIDPAVFKDLNFVAIALEGELNDRKTFVEKLNHFIDIRF
jgi:tetraacyldisaccharide 4'-kinase